MQNFSGTTNNVSQIFSAFEKKDFSSASTLILANKSDLNGDNANGQTVLHLLISESKNIPNYDAILNEVLLTSNIMALINKQDVNGNAPLHLAVINNDYSTCDRLIMAGADMKLRNKAGLYVEVEKPKESSLTETATSASMRGANLESSATDTLAFRSTASSYTMGSRGMPDAMSVTQTQQDLNSTTPSTISSKNSVFIKKNSLSSSTGTSSDANTSSAKDEPGILSNLINFLTRPFRNTTEASTTSPVTMSNLTSIRGGQSETDLENNIVNTSEFIDEIISSYNKSQQTGGRKRASKVRARDSESEMSEMSELSRMIQNQASEIHNRTITKIAELMGISEDEARVFKAYIYSQIKTEHPELNNYDRAVEMEKRITKDYLESISKKDIKDLKKTIEKNREERETKSVSKKTEEKPKKETKSKKSVKTTTTEVSETSYSLTSLTNTSS